MNANCTSDQRVGLLKLTSLAVFAATVFMGFLATYAILFAAAALSGVSAEQRVDGIPFALAIVPALAWFTYRMARSLVRASSSQPASLMLAASSDFLIALRLPVAVWICGTIASLAGRPPEWFWVAAVPIGIYLPSLIRKAAADPYATVVLRGTEIMSIAHAQALARRSSGNSHNLLNWWGVPISEGSDVGHGVIVGATGSGKTVSLRLYLQSLVPLIVPGSDRRLLLFDPKGDMLSILAGLPLRVPVVYTNISYLESYAVHMAPDLTTPTAILQFAHTIIPEEEGHNAFFARAARDLLAAVMAACHLTWPGQWNLADVILLLADNRKARTLLQSLPQTRHVYRDYFNRDPRTLDNIQQTITSHLGMLRPVAAAWARADQHISLSQWINGEFILVLGQDESIRAPMDAINRVIMNRITDLILSQPEDTARGTYIIIDELKEAGKLDCLPRLITKGRSKGLHMTLAFQTIEGLKSIYGAHAAEELAGLCSKKVFLRTDSPETARWMAQILGEAELREWRRSYQEGPNGASHSMAENIRNRQAALASELLRMPPVRDGKLHGYFVTPSIGVYSGAHAFAQHLMPPGPAPKLTRRPARDFYLLDYGKTDSDEADRRPETGSDHDRPR